MRKEIIELLEQEPFCPFVITLSSGQQYEVRFPGLLGVGKDIIYYFRPKSTLYSIIRLVQVAAVDIIE